MPKPKGKKKGKKRHTLTITVLVVAAVAIVVGAYLFTLGGGGSPGGTTRVPSSVLSQLGQFANSTYGTPSTSDIRPYSGTPLMDGDKVVVLFISGDYCPYCAAERWPLVLALMRFGTFNSLSYTYSNSYIEFPNTPSFSFDNYSYSSPYISLQAYEFEDRNGNVLDTVPDNYSVLWKGIPSNGTVPFLDIGNRYVVAGAQYEPSALAGMTQAQVVKAIVSGESQGKTIMAAADGITEALCNVTGQEPASVCAQIHTSSSGNFRTGIPSSTADAWATVQYAQMEWMRKISVPTR